MRERSASAGIAREVRLDARLVAVQQEAHVGMALQREGGAGHDDGRALVSAHRVERYGARRCHAPRSAPCATRQPDGLARVEQAA